MNHRLMLRGLAVLLLGTASIALALAAIIITPAAAQTRSITPAPAVLDSLPICFVSRGQTTCVDRPALSAPSTITGEIRALTQWLIAGPTSSEQVAGIASPLPIGTQLDQVSVIDDHVTIDLALPDQALAALTDQQVEDINEQFRTTFTPYNFQQIEINARGSIGDYRALSAFLPPPKPFPAKTGEGGELPSPETRSSVSGEGPGLRGKTVFVSAGHGWYWNPTLNSFKTQRPVYPTAPYPAGEGVIEDFNNAEVVNQYLLPYLQNAGADAWTVRERDMNTNMIIVDDTAGFSTQGSWASHSGGYNGTYRSATTVNASPTATATWTFTPPATATYAVYVRFPSITTTARTVDARFFVDHAGAITPITITQARDGNNWRFIGNYPFYGGRSARIMLNNQSATPGVTVLADAVRIGGGQGDTSVAGSPVSNKPRWEEQSRQYAKWVGMPDVDNLNDVIVRPIYSEWEKEAGEDAVYVSWHTNGYNGYNTAARGTESYIHSFEPTTNSNVLQNFIHAELLGDIHNGWEAGWPDRGKKTQDLGELRLLDSMPGVLIENGYHDNPTDVEAMKDPRFLQLSARAIYHGLVRYWNSIDPSVPLTFLPEPPQKAMMRNNGAGQIILEWQPGPIDGPGPLGDVATSYRVYTSTDGFGWNNPINVAGTSYTLTGLLPKQLIYAKVTGVNAGGESFATPVLAARATTGIAPILIVYGFDRIDRYGDIRQNDPPEGLSRRVFVDRINRFDYIIQHAEAITLPFGSAQQAAVSSGAIGLGNYTIVDWIAGENQAPFPALTANDQSALTNFLNKGGALFISGSEIGYELKNTSFLANTLRASYVADDAQTYSANSTAGGIFNGLGAINFDDGSHSTYDADFPDVLAPINGATSGLVYNTASAALQYANGCTRLVYSAIPFEAIYPAAVRQSVMQRILNYLGVCLPTTLETTIVAPAAEAVVNTQPAFNGNASSSATQVQVSIRRVSDGLFYNGSSFTSAVEAWLTAVGVDPWSYTLPALSDGAYALRAQATASSGSIVDPTPAAITFTLDTAAPVAPTIISPTNGVALIAIAPQFQWTGGGDPAGFHLQVDGVTTTLNSPALSATRVVTEGNHQWRVRAFDRAGNQSDWSAMGTFSTSALKVYLPLIVKDYAATQAPPAVACTDYIVNGGFEAGNLSGWSVAAPNPPPQITTTTTHGGAYAVRAGAATTADSIAQPSYSSVQQAISLPANAVMATLSFDRYRYSGDTTDLQYVVILSGSGTDYLVFDRVHNPQWLSGKFDLIEYAGQTITLRFGAYNNGSGGTTGMIIDDVMTQICVPQ
jgi:N-acetylmuramoyl-L-alanine amidase